MLLRVFLAATRALSAEMPESDARGRNALGLVVQCRRIRKAAGRSTARKCLFQAGVVIAGLLSIRTLRGRSRLTGGGVVLLLFADLVVRVDGSLDFGSVAAGESRMVEVDV